MQKKITGVSFSVGGVVSYVGVVSCVVCGTRSAAAAVPLPAGTHLGPHHEPVRSDSYGDYKSLATLLTVASAAPNTKHTHYSYRGRGQPPSATCC